MSTTRNTYNPEATIEDLEFLNDCHVDSHEATRRAGFPTREALEKWLRDHGRRDLFQQLAARDVKIPNYVAFDRTIFYTRRRCTS